jgi:hypothetical protein
MDYTPLDYFRCADYWATHYRSRFTVSDHIFIGFFVQYGFTKGGIVYRYTYKGEPISKSTFYVGYIGLIEVDELFDYDYADIGWKMYKNIPPEVENRIKQVTLKTRKFNLWKLTDKILFDRDYNEWEKHRGKPIEDYLKERFITVNRDLTETKTPS